MKIQWIENPNNFRVYAKLEGIEHLTKRAVRRGLFRWGKELLSTANEEILRGRKTGRIYIRRDRAGRRRRHRASAPGETHANMTGSLRRSMAWKVTGNDRLEFGYGINIKDAPAYAPFVEFGTFKMKPRPSLQNAIDKTTGNAERYFQEELEELNK